MKFNLFMFLLTAIAFAIALAHPINDNMNSDLEKRQDPNLEEKRQLKWGVKFFNLLSNDIY
ncbi:hypothetical protein C2G38_2206750 [Gigaspora rosea]|uniref:Uncharacterized protein n=1 Tax=Gigaspora rosea TaxID=44941 RepID=A0A397UIV3_9GLOM|nr:hypothetical protein C2G38_2206750 [Gigaspora rosea]